jgi:hypothetical protein
VSQSVYLTPGNYKFSFYYKNRTGNASSTMKVLFDGVEVGNASLANGSWNLVNIPLNGVTLGTHKITLQATGTQDTFGAFIDQASLNQVCN